MPPTPLHAYMDALVESLRDLVTPALGKFDEEAIHDARVATRRLKAAMDLLLPVLDTDEHRQFGRILRRLRRRLGPLRDADVMLGHLGAMPGTSRCAAALEWARAQLAAQREAMREKARRKGGVGRALERLGSWWAFRQQVRDLEPEAVGRLWSEALARQSALFAEQAARLVQAESPDPGAPRQDPHEVRISGKLLRYTLELAAVAGREAPPKALKSFKKLQDALGLWHDYVVLSQEVMRLAVGSDAAVHDHRLYAQVLDLSRRSLVLAEQQLQRFGRLWVVHSPALLEATRVLVGGQAASEQPAADVPQLPEVQP